MKSACVTGWRELLGMIAEVGLPAGSWHVRNDYFFPFLHYKLIETSWVFLNGKPFSYRLVAYGRNLRQNFLEFCFGLRQTVSQRIPTQSILNHRSTILVDPGLSQSALRNSRWIPMERYVLLWPASRCGPFGHRWPMWLLAGGGALITQPHTNLADERCRRVGGRKCLSTWAACGCEIRVVIIKISTIVHLINHNVGICCETVMIKDNSDMIISAGKWFREFQFQRCLYRNN